MHSQRDQLQKKKITWQTRNQLKLPKWLQDNEYIIDWHRPQLRSVAACLMSVFRVHSETGNIWTHLIGFLVILWLAFRDLTDLEVHLREKLAFGVSYFSSAVCLSMSAAFHTFCCHSASVSSLMNKLDYAGIAVMITGSFVTWVYYDFYCRRSLQLLYICVVGLMGSFAIAMSLLEKFASPQFRTVRAAFFAAFGLFGVVPAMNSVWLHGWDLAFEKSVCWCAIMAACYLTGAGLYASRIPERLFPGKCDV
uniref:HlyIII-domain-containing protein n=1 Tax=Macrostomum lignano TaxID=282301 RepID=A0A1I8FWE0_9PLAT